MSSKNAICNMQVLVVEEDELQNGGSGLRPGGDQGWNQGGGSWSGGFPGGQVANWWMYLQYMSGLLSGGSMDIATSNGPHLARWTRPAPRPRPITRLCCSQACLIIYLSVERTFFDTGEGTWFYVQMWLAMLEGSTLFGNGRTANLSQAVMSR